MGVGRIGYAFNDSYRVVVLFNYISEIKLYIIVKLPPKFMDFLADYHGFPLVSTVKIIALEEEI